MSNLHSKQKLKRQASSSDDDIAPVKQARTSAQNTHTRRLPPLRRSDTQVLDVNASTAVIEHLPPNVEPVSVPSELYQHRDQAGDMAGSTDSESQDEDRAWDKRAKAHRDAVTRRPPKPAPRIKSTIRIGPGRIRGVAVMDSSDSDPDNEFTPGETATRRAEHFNALRALRASAPKKPSAPTAPTATTAQPTFSSAPNEQTTVVTTTHRVTRTSSRTTVTTTGASGSVARRVKEINSRSISCPTRANNRVARAPSVVQAQAGPSTHRPQRQNSATRQNAIKAIAGHSSNSSVAASASASASALTALSATSSLSSMPSLILRRSRRAQGKQAQH